MPSIVASVLLMALPGAAPAQWTRLSTIDIEVIGDAGESASRAIVDRIQEARQVFPAPKPLPVKVFVLSKGDWFRRLRPSSTASAFASTDRAGTNVMVLSSAGDSRALLHEYSHLALEQMAILPAWLDEGFAEFYSTTVVETRRLVVGRPILEHMVRLRRQGVPALRDLMAVREALPGEFYPAAWSLVHMLRLGPGYRERFGAFWLLLQRGVEPARALTEAYGKTLARLEADWRAYVERPGWPVENMPSGEAMAALPRVETTAMERAAFEDEYVDLLRAAGLVGESTRMLAGLRERESPHRALRRAQFALGEGRLEDARREFERAAEDGGLEGDGWYEYAALLRDSGAPAADVRRALERAVAASPGFRPALLLLASVLMREGDARGAARWLEQAAARSARSFDVWYELAFAWRSAGETEKSRVAVEKALLAARTEAARERASSLLVSSTVVSGAKSDAPLPKGWTMARGDQTVEGRFVELVCGEPATVRMETASGVRELVIQEPGKVSLRGLEGVSTEMKCGAQEAARRIRVEFDSRAGEIRAIEFIR